MRSVPWLKRIELQTGEKTSIPLQRDARFVTTTVRDGFVREAVVGAIASSDLISTVHRLCHLRACLALERLVIDPRALGARDWGSVFSWTMWTDCRWPTSLKRLSFGPRGRGQGRPTNSEISEFREKLGRKYPALEVDA